MPKIKPPTLKLEILFAVAQVGHRRTSFDPVPFPFLFEVLNIHDSKAPLAFLLPSNAPMNVKGVTDFLLEYPPLTTFISLSCILSADNFILQP